MNSKVRHSYSWCERLARKQAANFYPAFRLLPRPQRLGMCALYSFLRVSDDLVDDGPAEGKAERLRHWRQQLDAALQGDYQHPLFPAFHDTIERYGLPPDELHAALDGVEMDLTIQAYPTFEELRLYCFRVASVVGLSCIHIWGCRAPQAREFAISAGIAFQLTNILRDLAEDAARGRIYLPREDLDRFGYSSEQLARGEQGDAFEALMRFEVERTYQFYREGLPLVSLLPPPGRAVFLVMLRTYRGLLDAIVRKRYNVFAGRIRVSRWYKVWQVMRALPVRTGLL